MILYKKANLRVAELWFDEEVDETPVDIVRHFQRTTPSEAGRWKRFSTILLDLEHDTDMLYQKMGKNSRYEIRRAETRDNFGYGVYTMPDMDCVNRFRDFHNKYANQRIGQTGHARMQKFAEGGALVLSEVQSEQHDPLVWHAYLRTEDRARLLYSSSLLATTTNSPDRTWLGRANRFLHWRDVLMFKERGVRFYDLGGRYDGHTDQKMLNINRFKEEFGGEVVSNYNGLLGISLLGKAALWIHARLQRQRTENELQGAQI